MPIIREGKYLTRNYFSNFVRVIGTGERCLPGDDDNCGDGGKAANARLSYPKGLKDI